MLTQLIRSVAKTYGYRFLKTEEFRDTKQKEYASLSIVDDLDGERKFLFMYLADEITRTHVLSKENIESVIASCQVLLEHRGSARSGDQQAL